MNGAAQRRLTADSPADPDAEARALALAEAVADLGEVLAFHIGVGGLAVELEPVRVALAQVAADPQGG